MNAAPDRLPSFASPTGPSELSATLADVEALLRDRPALLSRIARGESLARLSRALLATTFVCAAVFGAAVGSFRGGRQALYAALKLPLVLLLSAAICAPALTAANAALDRRADLRRDLALLSTALALCALVLASEAPLVLLAVEHHLDYHAAALLLAATFAVAGAVALSFLARGLAVEPQRRRLAAALVVAVFGAVVAQMAWTLRPWLVRPRDPSVTFVRDIDSSLFEAVRGSLDSARGVYHRDAAPLPGSVGDAR